MGRVSKCKDATDALDKKVCSTVLYGHRKKDVGYADPFEVTFAEVDLNNDGRKEIIARESSWAGTSGGALWVLRRRGGNLEVAFETEMTWSPIFIRDEMTNGWKDFSYQVQGGGVEQAFRTVEYVKGSYKDNGRKVSSQQPTGEIVIGRNWGTSVFGPTTK